jgi:hypothetical protein
VAGDTDAELAIDAAIRALEPARTAALAGIAQIPATSVNGILARGELLRTYPERQLVEGIEDHQQGRLILDLLDDLAAIPLCQ